jgi:GTP cyclohydrolase II
MDPASIAIKYALDPKRVTREIETAKRSMSPKLKTYAVNESGLRTTLRVTRIGVGPLETAHGLFHHFVFDISDVWKRYSVLLHGPVDTSFRPMFTQEAPLTIRVDSGCETGQLFGDRTCECRDQLEKAMAQISNSGQGLIINIPRQDGRGMGLPFKLATLHLQRALGVNTVESGGLLEPDASRDVRTYAGVVGILLFLDIPRSTHLELASNNPLKKTVFEENGFTNVRAVGCVIEPTEFTRAHLLAKQEELGHVNLVDKGGF